MRYEYVLGDNIEKPLRYQYTVYQGVELLQNWYVSRREILEEIGLKDYKEMFEENCQPDFSDIKATQVIDTNIAFQMMLRVLFGKEEMMEELKICLDGYVKSFEVRKRIYPEYSSQFRPINVADYHNMSLYTIFACVCAAAFEQYQDLRYINVLLKVNDTLISQWGRKNELKEIKNQERLSYAVKKELEFVKDIIRRTSSAWEVKA